MKPKNKFTKGAVQPVCIGVMGTSRGVGTTQLACMLANCCANGLGYRTAVIEYNTHGDFMKICDETRAKREDIRHFSYGGIAFYGNGTNETVAFLLNNDFEILILDMDMAYEESYYEFLRCDVKIAVCSTAAWRIGKGRRLSEQTVGAVTAAALLPDCGAARELERRFRKPLWRIPLQPDPFRISSLNLKLIKEFLEKIGPV